VTLDENRPTDREELAASDWASHQRTGHLVEIGVDTVICGGIDWWSAESLRSAGVTVYGGVTGEIEDALAALVRGELNGEAFTQPAGRWVHRSHAGSAGMSDEQSGPPSLSRIQADVAGSERADEKAAPAGVPSDVNATW
jgi:predicted Fe-Mo cluster-binding NifX family protein